MKIYRIEVRAEGYDTTCKIVQAANMSEARKSEREAVTEWIKYNDSGEDSRGLAFVSTKRI